MINLPPFIMTSEKVSFARKTIEERKPIIIDRILSQYDFTIPVRMALLDFKKELAQEPIKPLHEHTSDRFIWDKDLEPWLGKTWLEIPWFLAETYFFRRILELVHYFQPGPWMHRDPYGFLKEKENIESLPVVVEEYQPISGEEASLENFQRTCYSALWGNRGDLSNLDTFENDMGTQSHKIILNQTKSIYQFLSRKPAKIAYFFDNVGKELYFDLALIDFLLETNLAKSVTCYLKSQPFFVSDAMPEDLEKSIDLLITSQSTTVQNLAKRIISALKSSTIKLVSNPYFATSHMYRDMPVVLKSQVSSHDLAILKGDVNYRRLFGDRHWNPTTSVELAGGYFPTSFLSLRTLKSELILGMPEETINKMENEAEQDWLTNGKRGLITFLEKD
jgi:uncharacterized protein with ATP-grasp and redox domains